MPKSLLGETISKINLLEIRSSVQNEALVMDDTLFCECINGNLYQIISKQGQTALYAVSNLTQLLTEWEVESDEHIAIHEPPLAVVNDTVTAVTEVGQKLHHDDGDYLVSFIIEFENHISLCVICEADQINLVSCETLNSWIDGSNKVHYFTKHAYLNPLQTTSS